MARVVRPQATLEQWLATGTARQRRLATIVIERQNRTPVDSIARLVGVHRETVRRWLVRYRCKGLAAVADVPRTVRRLFDDETRKRIVAETRRAPRNGACGWSLPKLRAHLVRVGVVKHISIERLRFILNEVNQRPRSWREPAPTPIRISADEQGRLRRLYAGRSLQRRAAVVLAAADDAPIKAIATDLGMSQSTVRRWVRRYREGGVSALTYARPYREPVLFTAPVRRRIAALAAQSPRAVGVNRDQWSLELLRQQLVRSGIVTRISKEWLRQILRAEPNGSDADCVLEQFAEYVNAPGPHLPVA